MTKLWALRPQLIALAVVLALIGLVSPGFSQSPCRTGGFTAA